MRENSHLDFTVIAHISGLNLHKGVKISHQSRWSSGGIDFGHRLNLFSDGHTNVPFSPWAHSLVYHNLIVFTHMHLSLSFWYMHAPCILKSDFGLIFSHPQVSTGRQSPTHGCMTHLTPPNHPQKERKNEENSTTINGIAPRYWEHAYTKVCKLGLCCCFVFTSMDFSSRFESSCVYPE